MTADRIREIRAVLRLARGAMTDNPGGDAAVGMSSALRLLTDLDGDIFGAITEVHQCGPS